MHTWFIIRFSFIFLMHRRGSPSPILPSQDEFPQESSKKSATSHSVCVQYLEEKRAYCDARNLQEVPQDLYPDILYLDLRFNNLSTLRNTSFQFYCHLEYLNLQSANVHYIENGTFYPLKSLKTLELSENPGVHLHTDIFRWSSELRNLNLAHCQLNFLHFEDMEFMLKLEGLDLSANDISVFNYTSYGTTCKNIVVNLSSNNITELSPESFAVDCVTVKLYLDKNPIQFVDPDTIASLGLSDLSLGEYPLSRKAVRNLTLGLSKTLIERLSITSAGLRNITPDIFQPLHNNSLSYLSLAHNNLILYPHVFANLPLLSTLDLTDCNLISLEPEYFYGMSALRYIILLENYFHTVNPYNATWLISLLELNLFLSNFEEINEYTFKGLHNLTKLMLIMDGELLINSAVIDLMNLQNLSMVGNEFHTITLKAPQLKFFERQLARHRTKFNFQQSQSIEHVRLTYAFVLVFFNLQLDFLWQLPNLKILDLGLNDIVEIPFGAFKNISTLQRLYMNDNEIRVVHDGAFEGLHVLSMLNLAYNAIVILPDYFLKDMKVLTSLFLEENSLSFLNDELFADTCELANLVLSGNRFVGFNDTVFDPIYSSLKTVDISGNVLVCNCESNWLVTKLGGYLVHQDETFCSRSLGTLAPLRGKPITMFKPSDYCTENKALYSIIIAVCLAVSAILILCYHHRWLLKYKLFLVKLAILGYREIQDARDKENFEYDINMVFYDNDEEWVQETFRPALEERLPNYGRIAFGDKDLMLGMYYFDAVDYNVEKSFKTILLMSRAAVQDHIFMTKFRIAVNHVTDTQTENMVLVFLEDIPDDELPYLVRLYLSGQGAYLNWEEDEEGQEYFWNKLTKYMDVNLRVNHMIPPN